MPGSPLTVQNFRHGFLVDDEAIGGVTEMEAGDGSTIYSAYVSHYLTGETFAYAEFEKAEEALAFLGTVERAWTYEAVGCSSSKKTTGPSSCSSGGAATSSGCGSGACGTSGCA